MARIRGLHPSLNPSPNLSTNPSKSTTPTSSGGDPTYRKNRTAAMGLPTACEKTHSKNLWTFFSTILLVLIALPAVDLAAQDCIDFEINPATEQFWAEGDMVTDQYKADYGISFSVVVDGVHYSSAGPVIAEVGGTTSTLPPFDACGFAINQDMADCQVPPNTANRDQLRTDVSNPTGGLWDIGCFFLTDHACAWDTSGNGLHGIDQG